MDPESMEEGRVRFTIVTDIMESAATAIQLFQGEPGKYPQGACVLGETYMRCGNVRVRRNIIFVHFERHSYMRTNAC
jgi:hypothetical protein